jgi:diaminopimelate epimerase
MCDRKFGIGADGLLVFENSRVADIRMRIFNADGSQAQMCGNGARCIALFTARHKTLKIETQAGIISAQVDKDNVKIRLTDPTDLKVGISLRLNSRQLKADFINTGVPHAVIFVQGLEDIDVFRLGRLIRHHNKFAPAGTNVNFVEVLKEDLIKLRTYERGVEDETLACGTGSAAAAIITALRLGLLTSRKIKIQTKSQEVLQVYFERDASKFKNVWLEGKARIVYAGVYNV